MLTIKDGGTIEETGSLPPFAAEKYYPAIIFVAGHFLFSIGGVIGYKASKVVESLDLQTGIH